MSNEALRLAEAMEDEGVSMTVLDGLSLQAAALLRQQAERIAELEVERDQHKATATSCLTLLADIRMACGDNGLRMQPELVEFIGAMKAERDQLRAEVERLRADAERYRWLKAYDQNSEDMGICKWVDEGWSGQWVIEHDPDTAIDLARTTHKDEG